MEVVIDSHQENLSFKGAVGMKLGRRKRSLQGSVPVHEPNTNNPSCTHPKTIIEGDANTVDYKGKGARELLFGTKGNRNQITYIHGITVEAASWICCLKGGNDDQCKLYL